MTNRTWSVKHRVIGLCAVLVAVSLAVGAVGVVSVASLARSLDQVGAGTLPRVQSLANIQALGLEYRGTALLMGTPKLAEGYKKKQTAHLHELRVQIGRLLAEYGSTVSPNELSAYENTKSATNQFTQALEHFLELSLNGHSEEAGAFWSEKGGTISKRFRKALEDEVQLSHALADQSVASGRRTATWAKILSASFLGLALVLGGVLGFLFVRNISRILTRATRELQSMAREVTVASKQLAEVSNNLAESSSLQTNSLEETARFAQDVAQGTRRNAKNVDGLNQSVQTNEERINEAARRLDLTLESMAKITACSGSIATITKLIDGIAFQTNILALNAAVEAARAGEAGLGFAVVADEVRNLAAKSADAAKQIAGSIEESVESARSGKVRLDEVVVVIRESAQSMQSMTGLIAQVNQEASLQTSNVGQVAHALTRVQDGTSGTAAMAEENAAAASELQSQAESMRNVIAELRALV